MANGHDRCPFASLDVARGSASGLDPRAQTGNNHGVTICFLVSDLHGRVGRYHELFEAMEVDPPAAVFMAGDLLPSGMLAMTSGDPTLDDFAQGVLLGGLRSLRDKLRRSYPRVFVVLGNDDGRFEEDLFLEADRDDLISYMPMRKVMFEGHVVYGYPYVPPTPFRLKDWERYDVSRFVDPGCVAPEEGLRSREDPTDEPNPTIQQDLERLVGEDDVSNALFLFHSPPYQTCLDRAALDGKMVDYCPLDVHVGSIAIRRFIEAKQPLLTMHGHVHESASLTGKWRDQIGRTWMMSAAHDGPELSLVRFDLAQLQFATRQLR